MPHIVVHVRMQQMFPSEKTRAHFASIWIGFSRLFWYAHVLIAFEKANHFDGTNNKMRKKICFFFLSFLVLCEQANWCTHIDKTAANWPHNGHSERIQQQKNNNKHLPVAFSHFSLATCDSQTRTHTHHFSHSSESIQLKQTETETEAEICNCNETSEKKKKKIIIIIIAKYEFNLLYWVWARCCCSARCSVCICTLVQYRIPKPWCIRDNHIETNNNLYSHCIVM